MHTFVYICRTDHLKVRFKILILSVYIKEFLQREFFIPV